MTDDSRKHASTKPSIDWRLVYQHLQRGEYDAAAAWLAQAHLATQAEEPVIAALITTVRQICLACQHCRAKIAWHEQAIEKNERREKQLRLRAQAMLDHLREQTAAGSIVMQARIEETLADPRNWSASFWVYLWLFLYKLLPPFTLPSATGPVAAPAADTLPSDTAPAAAMPVASGPAAPVAVEGTGEARGGTDELAVTPAVAIGEPRPEANVPPPILEDVTTAELLPSATTAAPAAIPQSPTAHEEPLPPPVTVHPVVASGLPDVRQGEVEDALDSFDFIIYCFGPCRIYQKGALIEDWNGLKGLALFKYLVMQRGAPVPKDRLMDLFWPDADPEAARRNLHQAIYSLRRTLRQRDPSVQHIQFEHNQYLFNPHLRIWVDVEEFTLHVQRGQRLEAAQQITEAMAAYGIAEGLYQGDFLADDLYEEWTVRTRDHYRTTYLHLADRLSDYYLAHDEYTAAIAICQKMLTYDRSYEEAHRRLIRCYLAQGQRHLAIRQYHTCVQTLADELDVPPDEETKALYAAITAHSS